jgi:type II secretory pathway pseudopilin PulG
MSPTPISEPAPVRRTNSAAASRRGQEGVTLAALIVILTIIAIVIAYTVPTQWSLVMKRERDRQTIFLMKQYARGIMAFQQKHNSLPVSLEQLQDAKEPRFLRGGGKWPMPLTGDAKDWIMVPPGAVQGATGIPGGGGVPAQQERIIGGNPGTHPRPGDQGAAPAAAGKLNKELSPKDYVGPFVGVRPNYQGESFIALNDAEDYSEWVYTIQDLQTEIQARQQALTIP